MIERDAATAAPSEPLAALLARMAESGVTQMPVVDPQGGIVVGSVSLANTLKAKRRHIEEETRRERIVPLGLLIPSALRPRRTMN
jgi:predicted transcriptional regulator